MAKYHFRAYVLIYARSYSKNRITKKYNIFFHPDYTVGPGISPDHALRLVGFTTGRESHPALKILFNLQPSKTYHAENVKGALSAIPRASPRRKYYGVLFTARQS